MNIILFEQEEIIAGQSRVSISDHRAKHIVKVLRSETGDVLKIGVINGLQGRGIITSLKSKYPFEVTLDVSFLEVDVEEKPTIDLVLAMPRPIMLKRILSQVTTLGVGKIYIINAGRVEKSFWQASIIEEEEYRTHLIIGLEQAVATNLPAVIINKSFKDFTENKLTEIIGEYHYKVIADPSGGSSLADHFSRKSHKSGQRVLLAVGSEGGWLKDEIDVFRNNNFVACNIGKRILKVDTAVVALHSAITNLL
ncbi:MAG: 16S rRNA (uracil(1498)-N(3))-methyltransferase [Desulfotalea sp.]